MWIHVVVRPLAIKNKNLYNRGRSVLHKKGEGAGVPSREEKTSCSLKGNIISKNNNDNNNGNNNNNNRGAGESPSITTKNSRDQNFID